MALYDLDATLTGSSTFDGSMGLIMGVGATVLGNSLVVAPEVIDHEIIETLTGSSSVTANPQTVFNMSAVFTGSGTVHDALLIDLSATFAGSSNFTAEVLPIYNLSGVFLGGSSFVVSEPEPFYGVGIMSAFMEVIHVPPPVCLTPQVNASFRWGHQFTRGDLEACIVGRGGNPVGPVCITYTLYQMVRGCAPIQKGPTKRKPASFGVGCYYATGTAGECGQPGLWMIRWSYQITYGDPVVERDCYFTVLDSVLSPVPGDNLQRVCKYGWD